MIQGEKKDTFSLETGYPYFPKHSPQKHHWIQFWNPQIFNYSITTKISSTAKAQWKFYGHLNQQWDKIYLQSNKHYLHLYSAPSLSINRMGNTLAQGVSHFWIRIPNKYGGVGSTKSCSDWYAGVTYKNPPCSLLLRKLWLKNECPKLPTTLPAKQKEFCCFNGYYTLFKN